MYTEKQILYQILRKLQLKERRKTGYLMSITITANNDSKNKKTNLHRVKEKPILYQILRKLQLKERRKTGYSMSIAITANNDSKNKKTNFHGGKENKFCIIFLEN